MKSQSILIIFLLLFVYPIKPAQAKNKSKIKNHGVLIDYTDSEKGDTTLLFVHGWCLNKSYWVNQVAFFSKRYRVVTIDLPGFGLSGKNRNDWSTANYATDVNAVINQLHLKKVILIGHSMAGDIVLKAAINNPNKVISLVGVDNFKAIGHTLSAQELKNNIAAMNEMKLNFKKIAFQYFNQSLFSKATPSFIKKRILNDVAHTDSTTAIKSLEESIKQMQHDEGKLLLRSKKKLYLINSDYTTTDRSNLITNHIPYQIFYIHNTGHFPMVEKPTEFNSKLLQIVRSI